MANQIEPQENPANEGARPTEMLRAKQAEKDVAGIDPELYIAAYMRGFDAGFQRGFDTGSSMT